MFSNKRIILGITGSIAAYKAPQIARELVKLHAKTQVVMTPDAVNFISPLTLQTLTNEPVSTQTFPDNNQETLAHIKLAQTADLLLIAPASANTIAKMAAGIGDNLLTALYLATKACVLIAPAMNCNMYTHPATAANIEILKKRGAGFIEPAIGELACGDEGIGRLADISDIIASVREVLTREQTLANVKILITAGPTVEPIDDMRFISNRSSGKMGYALAREAKLSGADVTLISGPVNLEAISGINLIKVNTANQMKDAVEREINNNRVLIMAAAVADYTPAEAVSGKIKKSSSEFNLKLSPASDIIASIGKRKDKPLLVGFAAESENILEYAREKLKNKNMDMIVANNLNQAGSDNNQIFLIDRFGNTSEYPLISKRDCAKIILDKVKDLINS